MTDKYLSSIHDMNQSISIDPSALLTTSTINALHFPDLTTSGISDSGGGRPKSFILDGIGMCESMTESFCSVSGQDESMLVNTTNGLQLDTSLKSLGKKDSVNAQKQRRSRKAKYDAVIDGLSLDRIEPVNIHDEQNEADDNWLYQMPENGNKTNPKSDNIFSWVHKEFKENDINATKHRLLCKLDDMSHARTIRSISCHTFAGNQRSDSVKRSSTEQQVNQGINTFILHSKISPSDLLENALYLTEIFTIPQPKNVHLSTLSLDSIEKDNHDHIDLFLYDSLNDESDDDENEQFYDCSNDTVLLQTIANERQLIEQLTRRCSSLDSLDNNDNNNTLMWSKPTINGRMTSPLRSGTPLFNGNGNTRPTSPASSSPLRHTIAATSASINVRSRDASKERERETLDYTDLEVMAKVQLEKLRLAERQGPLSKRFGGSSNTLLSTDSRDASPSSVFGATRNTSPVSNSGYMTPRRVPIRKNSFVVTESQYTHVLPSVSPRSQSPAIRTGQWSGRVTPSALETCMEASFISSNNLLPNLVLPNTADSTFADSASDQPGYKPPVAPKSLVPKNGVKPNNHRRSNTQTITTTTANSYDLPDATDVKTPTTRNSIALPNSTNNNNRARPPVSRPLQNYRGSQTSYNNSPKAQLTPPPSALPPSVQKNGKKPPNDLGSTFTAKQFGSNENNLLNDVSNKPRSQVAPLRRPPSTQSSVEQIPSSSSIDTTPTNGQSSIPRSSSTLSQGRKSGIPTIGKQQRPSVPTPTRPSTSNAIPSSQSSDSMMATRNIRAPASITRPQIPDTVSPTSSWNEGCY
ncbi:unnamed protein product [Adineta steineri]|uniref:Uncharacterized protein n=1 Tax=Adineta steineri TaxID=433720 RepID=A0A814KD55_9BILA|nr:unnamed protein product [Adineta steineri]